MRSWLLEMSFAAAICVAVLAMAQPAGTPPAGVTITLTAEQAQAVAAQVGGGEGLEYAQVMLPHVVADHAEAVAELQRLQGTTPNDPQWNNPQTGKLEPGGPVGGLPWERVLEAYRNNPNIPPTNAHRRALAIQAAQRLYEDAIFRLQRTRSAIERLGGEL